MTGDDNSERGDETQAMDIFRQRMDEHDGEGWMFLCRKCEAHYSIDGPTDKCPVCGWRSPT
jgi:rubrerythrin